MKNFYSFLRGIMALVLLCVPTLASVSAVADNVPDDVAGKYIMTLGELDVDVLGDEVWLPELPESYTGWITIDSEGKALMKGLIGTPQGLDDGGGFDSWEYIDSCYVGTYNAADETITFTYPEGSWDIIDSDWNVWQMSQPFTVKVERDDAGVCKLSTTDDLVFLFGESTELRFKGITMQQQPKYTMEREDLLGYWKLTFTTYDDNYQKVEGDSTMTFKVYEGEDGQLFVTKFFGCSYEHPATYDALTGLKIASADYHNDDWSDIELLSGDLTGMSAATPVWFSFGPDSTLILETGCWGNNNVTPDFWVLSGTAQKVDCDITPAPGKYEAMPTTFVISTGNKAIASATVLVRSSNTSFRGEELPADSVKIEGDAVTISVPASYADNASWLTLVAEVTDADGKALTYGDSEGYVMAEYEADIVSNTYEVASIEPANASTVESLKSFNITMQSPLDNDFIGGYDTSKQIIVKDADGNTVATGTIANAASELGEEAFLTNNATITLDQEVTAEGAYTLVVPEGTIYNSLFDDSMEDLGVAEGAIYNPEYIAIYSVVPAAPSLGQAVTSISEVTTDKAYVLYNDHFTTYAISDPSKSETALWAAGMIGDSGHPLVHEVSDLDITDPGSSWMLIQKGEGEDAVYYLFNLGNKKYLTTGYPCEFSDDPVALTLTDLGDGKFAFTTGGEYDYMCCAPQVEDGPICTWTSDDAGSAWQIIENPNVEADIMMVVGDPVSAISEISTDKAYLVYNEHFTAYAIYDAAMSETNLWAANMIGDEGHGLIHEIPELDITEDGSSWMLVKDSEEDAYYLYNVGSKKFVTTGYPCTFSEEPVALTLTDLGDGKFALTTGGEYDYMCCAPQVEDGPICTWTSDDAGSAWQFYENPLVEADAACLDKITGIQQVEAATGAKGIYSIQGIKLNITDPRKLQKGLYIIDGKKVLVK